MDYNILKNLLKERGLTFQDLADKLNTDRANLYTSLTKGNPTLQRLESVANVLGVPIWRLFTIDTKPEIYGSITYKGCMYSISSIADFYKLKDLIEQDNTE